MSVARSIVAGAASLGLVVAIPAVAQQMMNQGPGPSDPLIRQGEFDAGPHRFFLNNNDDTEIARFKSPHLLSICAGRGHPSPTGWVKGYPLRITWDMDSATVSPGACLSFEASRVKIRPGSELPQNIVLEGAYTIEN